MEVIARFVRERVVREPWWSAVCTYCNGDTRDREWERGVWLLVGGVRRPKLVPTDKPCRRCNGTGVEEHREWR